VALSGLISELLAGNTIRVYMTNSEISSDCWIRANYSINVDGLKGKIKVLSDVQIKWLVRCLLITVVPKSAKLEAVL